MFHPHGTISGPWSSPTSSRVHSSSSLSGFAGGKLAPAARVGGFPLLTVLIYVADEHPTAYASVGSRRSRERRNNRVIGGCLLVYFCHGRRRYRARRGDGVPQGSRATHQSDSEPDALAGHDRWRELPRPSYAPLYGARHDRSRIPRSAASQGSLIPLSAGG